VFPPYGKRNRSNFPLSLGVSPVLALPTQEQVEHGRVHLLYYADCSQDTSLLRLKPEYLSD
jgi:hypothetical protein